MTFEYPLVPIALMALASITDTLSYSTLVLRDPDDIQLELIHSP